ncbi:zinc finger protein [Teratosphaeria destructans]|uniref:Zinc finger protein n=1 Tax=Teratosphaeria destructans TaxID=418781 RepID=A0A9W7SUG0_9PEZI|nr:zinc finger protein [Teratosphaeria destructans]
MAQPNKPKAMSSRLATMKFMQRAAASTPDPGTPEPPAKKQRMSNGASYSSSGSTPQAGSPGGQDTSLGDDRETKWYLSYKQPDMPAVRSPLRIVSAGYSMLDSGGAKSHAEESDDVQPMRPSVVGRKSFGKFNKVIEKQNNPDMSSSDSDSDSDDGSSEEEDGEDDPTGANALIKQARKEAGNKARAQRKAQKKEEKAEAARLAEERRKKHVKLNKLTRAISSETALAPEGAMSSIELFLAEHEGALTSGSSSIDTICHEQ